MVRKNFTPEQIIHRLREAEIHINQGISISEASRKIGVTEQTYYRWRKEYGGLRIEQAKRLRLGWRFHRAEMRPNSPTPHVITSHHNQQYSR